VKCNIVVGKLYRKKRRRGKVKKEKLIRENHHPAESDSSNLFFEVRLRVLYRKEWFISR